MVKVDSTIVNNLFSSYCLFLLMSSLYVFIKCNIHGLIILIKRHIRIFFVVWRGGEGGSLMAFFITSTGKDDMRCNCNFVSA